MERARCEVAAKHEVIALPPLPPLTPPEPPKRGGSFVPILLASILAIIVCTVLFFLTLGGFIVVIVIGGAIFVVGAMHYVLWGWWLGRVIKEDVDAEEKGNGEWGMGKGE